ncbi:MAG TPA: TetR family transcriptional regulator C-terminal domain-containing protein, partial [Spirochaetota bacterium]|nr:TetR family transcriptional regulator C-terminal domain-containing protein [Spirochaetota bacterium]
SESIRLKISEAYDKVRIPIRDCISESISRGEIHGDADDLSITIVNLWEGTLMNMKVLKTGDPIDRFIRTIFTDILRVKK